MQNQGLLKYLALMTCLDENVHSWPVEEPLHELAKDCEVIIVGCKPQEISSPDVEMGLTEPVEKAIPEAMDIILKEIGVK